MDVECASKDMTNASPGPVVLWDSYGLQNPYSGIGYYGLQLYSALKQMGCTPQVIPSQAIDENATGIPTALKAHPLSFVTRFKPIALTLADLKFQEFFRKYGHIDRFVIHGLSNFNLPRDIGRRAHGKRVITVHDLIPDIYPQGVSRTLRSFLRRQMPKTLERADAIICVSQWTRDALEERYPSVSTRTVVIPNGFPEIKSHRISEAQEKPSILTVARYEAYKRLDLIPKIAQQLAHPVEWNIVTDDKGEKLILEGLSDDRLKRNLRFHKRISHEQLEKLFETSSLYLHPSLYEGFCLPAAQAIAHGLPVLYCRGSGIDEVVQSAGLGLGSHQSPADWAQSIEMISASRVEFQKRVEHRQRDASNWKDVATRTHQLYDKI